MIRAWDIPASAEMGVLLSMTEWLERDGIGMDIWFPAEIESARWEGDIYGLPMRTGGDANSLMFYNIDMLDQAGIGEVPTTWDELHAISRRLVRYDGDQLLQASISPHGGDLKSPAWLAAGGGLLYSADGKQVLFEGPRGWPRQLGCTIISPPCTGAAWPNLTEPSVPRRRSVAVHSSTVS